MTVKPYETRYEHDYIRLTTLYVRINRLMLIVNVLALVALGTSTWYVFKQLQQNSRSTESGQFISESNWTIDIDKLFIDHPEMLPYFEAGRDVNDTDKPETKLLAVGAAEMLMDSMDSMLATSNDGWPDPGWKNWAYDIFHESPVFRRRLEERRSWYCRHLYPQYLEWAKSMHHNVPAQAKCN